MNIIVAIAGFFISALALKFALSLLGQVGQENKYGTAITTSGVLSSVGLVLSFFTPFFISLPIYAIFWLMMVRSVYGISLKKSVALAGLMVGIRYLLMFALGWLI